jgi:hypothetical protein
MTHKRTGKHRFIVRTHQHLGTKPTFPFALYQATETEDAHGLDRRDSQQDPRACLLARVAGDVASGLVQNTASLLAPDAAATASVDIAEAILRKAGL